MKKLRYFKSFTASILIATLTACSANQGDLSGVIGTTSPSTTTTTVVGGGGSSTSPNQLIPLPVSTVTIATTASKTLRVRAINGATGGVLSAASITFEVAAPAVGCTLTSGVTTSTQVTAVTDVGGYATVTFNSGSTIGPVSVLATSSSGGIAVFSVTVGASGTGSQILKTLGDEGIPISTSTAKTVQLLALDGNNDPIVGASVNFTIGNGGTGVLTGGGQTASTVTDSSGYAQTTYTSGTTTGTMVIVATVASVGSTAFSIVVGSSGGGGGGASLSFSPSTFSPASTTWVGLDVGSTADKSVTMTNSSGSNLYITSLSSNAPFSVLAGDTCARAPSALASGAACSISIRFTPTDSSTSDRFLYVNWSSSSDGSNPQVSTVALQASGPQPLTFGGITSVNGATSTSLTANWTNIAGNSGYKIYDVTSGAPGTYKATATANATSYTITGLTPNTAYTFRVRALNSANVEDTNTASAAGTTLSGVPVLSAVSNSVLTGSKSGGIYAGTAYSVDVNDLSSGSATDSSVSSYGCYVGRTINSTCDYTGGGGDQDFLFFWYVARTFLV